MSVCCSHSLLPAFLLPPRLGSFYTPAMNYTTPIYKIEEIYTTSSDRNYKEMPGVLWPRKNAQEKKRPPSSDTNRPEGTKTLGPGPGQTQGPLIHLFPPRLGMLPLPLFFCQRVATISDVQAHFCQLGEPQRQTPLKGFRETLHTHVSFHCQHCQHC